MLSGFCCPLDIRLPPSQLYNLSASASEAAPSSLPQINFAGEGGLYVEMIQDRSFDAMALAVGFKPGNATVPLRPPGGVDPARYLFQCVGDLSPRT